MKIESFEWDENNEEHIARHGITPEEVEEVFFGKPLIYKSKYGRYMALGETIDGFFLSVIFEYLGKKEIRIVTARAMSNREQRLYRQKRRY